MEWDRRTSDSPSLLAMIGEVFDGPGGQEQKVLNPLASNRGTDHNFFNISATLR